MFERDEVREQSRLRKRLRATTAPKTAKRIGFVKEAEKLSAIKSFDAALARTSGAAGSIQKLLTRADIKLTVGGLFLVSACVFLGGWLAVGWITRLPWIGFAVGCLLAFVPYLFVRFKATKRLRTFEEQ